ncbi:MAG: HypC/HybG/HupF family hydrogenase formation chaperone [Gammaproteobacteria bacterium]|nr:HypC/HybG/HupF family hydrogenase formation chaperone [Gammaproteobacteria bacterium]
MCLAIPAEVTALNGDETAVVTVGGVAQTISLALVDKVAVGDYLLIHVGYALNKLSAEEAEKTLRLFADAGLAPSQ